MTLGEGAPPHPLCYYFTTSFWVTPCRGTLTNEPLFDNMGAPLGVRGPSMPDGGYREEVLNVVLALLLLRRGVVNAPEQVLRGALAYRRAMPDVIVEMRGLRVAIEGKVEDNPNTLAAALGQARERVERGLAHLAVAVVYPASLRQVAFSQLEAALAEARLQGTIYSETASLEWSGDVNDLIEHLRRALEGLVAQDVVAQAAEELRTGVDNFSRTVYRTPALAERARQELGISQPRQDLVGRIAGLILVNAMLFQELLSEHDARVQTLRQTIERQDVQTAFCEHWEHILIDINYYPIFHVARQLLLALPSGPDVEAGLRALGGVALRIAARRAALRHDLMGRVYHTLLSEAKYLGTYYTSVPAATLLLKLALDSRRFPYDWHDLEALRGLRIADLACGTGTLLMAAAETVTDNYVRACALQGQPPDLGALARILMEDIIHGYDVLLSALHLTASTLALRAPEVTFRQLNLWCLPLGVHDGQRRLGSLEFLTGSQLAVARSFFGPLFTRVDPTGDQVAGTQLPKLDLCCMNPPFTRSVGGNLLFGNLPEGERQELQKELGRLLARPISSTGATTYGEYASATAGLGSVFTLVADRHVKEGGRLALVLPKAVLSGVAWERTRKLLAERYLLEYVVVSHEPDHWNFSENTDLSEALLVARRLRQGEEADDRPVVFVNLWRNPGSPVEALAIAHAVLEGQAPDLVTGQGAHVVRAGETTFGEAVSLPWGSLKSGSWLWGCAFAQADLIRAAFNLAQGKVWLPGQRVTATLPLCPLRQLGDLGPDVRDIRDGFQETQTVTPYPAFWGHDAEAVTSIAQEPNSHLSPLPQARPGRPLRQAAALWAQAGRLLVAERLWLKTQRVVAVRCPDPVLSNVWWPVYGPAPEEEKALAIWLNSTLGLLLLIAHRQETRGAWVKFKKPVLSDMPVLDVRSLDQGQRKRLSDAYDVLASEPLLPFPQMAEDSARQLIDEVVQDALGLPDVAPLREMLAREPIICLHPLP